VGVRLATIDLHLTEESQPNRHDQEQHTGGAVAYVFCDAVDEYYNEIKKRGAFVMFEPRDWPYGMRDFRVRDVDGNYLSFGCALQED